MKIIIFIFFVCLTVCSIAAENDPPKLPKTAIELLEKLKETKGIYITWEIKLNYVKEEDLPRLIELLDSNEPCAYSVMSLSSHLPTGRSTVGNEAAFLIESFWKRYYPTNQTSRDKGVSNKKELKSWYKMWTNLNKLTEQKKSRRMESRR